MSRKGNYFIFSPPYSKSEHFVKVTDVENSRSDGNQYVHYKHVLNNDMEDNYEQSYFDKGATLLNLEKVQNIVSNIESEIENLKEKKKEFEKLKNKMETDTTTSRPHQNATTNGTFETNENYEKKELEKVRSN